MSGRRKAALALGGAAVARAALTLAGGLAARPAGAAWHRTNYAGRPLTLLGGPVLAASATAASVLGAPAGTRAAAALVAEGGGTSGNYGAGEDTQPVPPVPAPAP